MTLILPLALANPAAGEGEVPDWQVGDKWAVGVSKDLSSDFDAALAEMKANLSAEPDVDSVDYTTAGKAGYFANYEVVDSGDPDLVKVVGTRGIYMHLAVTLTVTGQYYLPGNYTNVTESYNEQTDSYEYELDKGPLTMALRGGADFVLKVDSTALFTKDRLELKELSAEVTLGAEAALGVVNVPEERTGDEEYDFENDTTSYDWVNIEFNTGKLAANARLHLLTETTFEPALDVFNFPIEANEVWNDTANVTTQVSFWGDIDFKKPVGADPEDIKELLDNADKAMEELEWNKRVLKWSDLFPLHIPSDWMNLEDKLPGDAQISIENDRFVIGPETMEGVNFTFRSGQERSFTLPDGTPVQGFPILLGEPEEEGGRGSGGQGEAGPFGNLPFEPFVSGEGKMVGARVELEEAPGGGLTLESTPVAPEEADTALQQKADAANPRAGGVNAQGYVTDEETPEPIDDVGPSLPAPGLLPVVAVVAGLALLVRRRLKL